jgi:hypothetical protein
MKSQKKRRQLTRRDLRALGATPGLQLVRYRPDGKRVEIRQLTAEGAKRPLFLRPGSNSRSTREGER